LVHGVADTASTLSIFLATENSSLEANPLMRALLVDSYWLALNRGVPLWATVLDEALLKLAVVALVAVVAWRIRSTQHWRPMMLLWISAGLLVVANHALVLLRL
jgi:hypothetical protein